MSSNKSTFHTLVEHLTIALEPLSDSVSDITRFKEFMFRLGWNVESLPPSFVNLASRVNQAQQALDSLPQDPSIDQISNVLLKVKEVYSALQSITEAPDGVDADVFLSEIAERIFEILLADYLRSELPTIHNALKMLGIIDIQYFEPTDFRPSYFRTRFKFEQIEKLISDPLSIPEIVYAWGTKDLDLPLIIDHIHELFQSLNFPTSVQRVSNTLASGYQPSQEKPTRPIARMVKIPIFNIIVEEEPVEASLSLLELPAEGEKLPGLILQPKIPQEIGQELKVDDNLTIKVRPGTDLSSLFGFLLRPGEISFRNPLQPDSKMPDAGFGITLDYLNETPTILFGSQDGSRLETKGISLSLNANYDQAQSELIFLIEAALKELLLVITTKDQDTILAKLLGGSQCKVPIPLLVGWSSKRGFYFGGGSGMYVTLSPHLSIGGVKIDKLTLQMFSGHSPDSDPKFGTQVLMGLSGSVGPVTFSIDDIGLQFRIVFNDGNSGPFDLSVGIVLPKGIGLAIEAQGVKGGGFISKTGDHYSGILDLKINRYSLQALAILKTEPKISVLLAIFTEFKTPIQLGGGWKITNVGGLLGINHTVSHASIASGIKTGILDSIMFPSNIIANASSVITNYETVFPVLYGQSLIGPAIRIAYGTPTLLTGDIAVILEFPNPLLLSILGKITSKLPTQDNPIVEVNIGVLGALDFLNGKAEVYGSLYDSRVLGFSLSGDMAMALSWGFDKNFIFIKNFIFSVGGFNPRFTPPPNFPPFGAPPLKRLNIAFSSNVKLECYMALTSNTFQVGARIDATFSAGGATISGYLEFDALVQFSPLHFIVDIQAGLSVKYKGYSLASIKFSGFLEGPNTYRINGSVRFSILWWSISKSIDKTFGDPVLEVLTSINPWDILSSTLKQNDSWSQDIPTWSTVSASIKESTDSEDSIQLIQPFGNLKLSENVVPFNHTLTKFGTADPIANFRFEIKSLNNVPVQDLALTQDFFAPGHFTKYDNSELLSLKSYDLMDSGIYYSPSEQVLSDPNSISTKEMSYETIILGEFKDKDNVTRNKGNLFSVSVLQAQSFVLSGIAYSASLANDKSKKYRFDYQSVATSIKKEKFIIIDEDDNMAELPFGESMSQASALNTLAHFKRNNPEDRRNLNVLSKWEVEGAVI